MKDRLVVLVLLTVGPSTHAGEIIQADDGGRDRAVAPAWPPPFMQQLPADYLDRQRASLVAGTGRLSRLHFTDTTSADSIGWVRYGMP